MGEKMHTPETDAAFEEFNGQPSAFARMAFHAAELEIERDALREQNAALVAVVEREAQMPCRCAGPHSQCIPCQARAALSKCKGAKP